MERQDHLKRDKLKPKSVIVFLILLAANVQGAPFLGELSLSAAANGAAKSDIAMITRYLPALEYQSTLAESWDYDVEVRWQLQWGGQVDTLDNSGIITDPYRVALNLQSANSEYVIGLQKINFGPARLLRPLMWFDSINPTDPLALTSGVTGISAKFHYDFGWSSQAWLFLPGDPIGWEGFPDQDGTFETGGRISMPNNMGQLGISTHWRIADASSISPDDPDLYEGRIGVDGFWDVGIGLWVESVYKNQQLSDSPFMQQLQTTIGGDYTFWVGNGVLLITEHMLINIWDSPVIDDTNRLISTVMTSYSPTMFDQLSLMLFMDWETNTPLAYMSWGQTYDSFRFTLGAFYTDVDDPQDSNTGLSSNFSGKGIQLIVAYNH